MKKAAVLIACVLCFGIHDLVAEPFQNGGFESELSSWSVSHDEVVVVMSGSSFGLSPLEGSTMVAFSGADVEPIGSISQVFDTVPGRVYAVRFSVGDLGENDSDGVSILASVKSENGHLLGDLQVSGPSNDSWTSKEFVFTAISKASEVLFARRPIDRVGRDIALDSVSIMETDTQPNRLADSLVEFSDMQGDNNWEYGIYNLSEDLIHGYDPTVDFQQLPTFSNQVPGFPNPGWTINDQFWTYLGAQEMHPNSEGGNGGKTSQEHWAIRRWTSNTTSLVRLTGRVAKHPHSLGGDGVNVMVFVNGRRLMEQFIGPNDGVSVSFSLNFGIQEGDVLDFALGDAGGIIADSALFSVTIDQADFVLSTSPAIEVSVPTVPGTTYQIMVSPDFDSWRKAGEPFVGNGDTLHFLFSSREFGSPAYFRAEEVPE